MGQHGLGAGVYGRERVATRVGRVGFPMRPSPSVPDFQSGVGD